MQGVGVVDSALLIGRGENEESEEDINAKKEKGFLQKLKGLFWEDKDEQENK